MPGVQQMNRQRINLEVRQDDPQRTVAYGVCALVVEHPGHANALSCGPNNRLGRGNGEAWPDGYVDAPLRVLWPELPSRGR